MIFPLMAGSFTPMPLACPPDDAVAWLCFLLGFGLATLVFLVLAHVTRRF